MNEEGENVLLCHARGEEKEGGRALFSTWDSIFSSVAAALGLFPTRTGRLNLAGAVAET